MYICDEISTNIEINMFCFLLVVTWTSKIVFLGSQRFFFSTELEVWRSSSAPRKTCLERPRCHGLCWDRRDRFVFPPRFCPVQTTMGRIKNKWWGCDFFHIKFVGGFGWVLVLKDTHLQGRRFSRRFGTNFVEGELCTFFSVTNNCILCWLLRKASQSWVWAFCGLLGWCIITKRYDYIPMSFGVSPTFRIRSRPKKKNECSPNWPFYLSSGESYPGRHCEADLGRVAKAHEHSRGTFGWRDALWVGKGSCCCGRFLWHIFSCRFCYFV